MDGTLAGEKWLAWKKKRRNTLIAFVMIGSVVGIDSSVIYSTLYPYLTNLVRADQPKMYYGLIYAFFYISSTIFAMIFGRWLDRTRQVRMYINYTLTAQILGFLLYTIPYHAGFLLVGRFICGIGDPFISVIAGEILRIYTDEESNRAILWLASTYSFGFIIGPSLNYFFKGVYFKVGQLVVNNYNFIGIFMTCVILLIKVAAHFLVHDCSAEFDLKEYLKLRNMHTAKSDETDNEVPKNMDVLPDKSSRQEIIDKAGESTFVSTSENSEIPLKRVLASFHGDIDILLVFVATFVLMYTIMSATMLLPLLVLDKLMWNEDSLSFIYAGYGIGDLILLTTMAKYCITNKSIYYTGLVSIFTQLVMYCLLFSFNFIQRHVKRDIAFMVLFVICLIIGYSFDDVIIRVMLANMVPSSIQSFTEGLRAGVSKVAIIIAAFSTPLLLPWLNYWSGGVIILTGVIFLCFLVRRKKLIDPKEITFVE